MTFTPDKGWAWVVLSASVVSNVVNGLIMYSVGVFNLALIETYHNQVDKIAFMVSLNSCLFALTGPLVSLLVNLTNCKTCHFIGGLLILAGLSLSSLVNNLDILILTFGIIAGTGTGLCYISCVITVGYYFKRMRPLAMGITLSATGVGMFCGAFVTQKIRDYYGLNGTFLLLGGLSANLCVVALLMRPTIYEKKAHQGGQILHRKVLRKKMEDALQSLRNLVKNKPYLALLVAVFLDEMAYVAIIVHEQAFVVQTKVATKDGAVMLMTALSIANTLGRYLTGLVINKKGVDSAIVYIVQLTINGTITLLIPLYYDNYYGHLAFCIVTGFNFGGIVMLCPSLTFSTVDVEVYASAIGLVYLLVGTGVLIGPTATGVIVANGGTYVQGFLVVGGLTLLAAMFALLFCVLRRRQSAREVLNIKEEDPSEQLLCRSESPPKRQHETHVDVDQATKSFSMNHLDKMNSSVYLRALNMSTHSLNI